MKNPRLAARYAKSLIDLAIEQNKLEEVYTDMRFILRICKSNPDFVAVLDSPVIKPTAKGRIIESITENRVGVLTTAFIKLLVHKTRELNLPEIASSYVDQYNEIKDIHKVKITTAIEMTEELKTSILTTVLDNIALENIDLETVVDESLIGGFILESEGKSIDASILKDLKEIQLQFFNNEYLHKIR
jgi:F-type H+-transporting ATPase subunit delta